MEVLLAKIGVLELQNSVGFLDRIALQCRTLCCCCCSFSNSVFVLLCFSQLLHEQIEQDKQRVELGAHLSSAKLEKRYESVSVCPSLELQGGSG